MFDNIPQELRERAQWVCWKYEPTDSGKPTKVPYNVRTGYPASSTDRTTWSRYDEVTRNAAYYSGIGFVLAADDPYCFIDLDAPKGENETENARAAEGQQKIYAAFAGTYGEISPSGYGLHIIAQGAVPRGVKNGRLGVEIYSEARFMTMTGNVAINQPITQQQWLIDNLFAEIGGSNTPTVENQAQRYVDATIIERANKASNGLKFRTLWNGDTAGFPSQSEADQALMNILAFYTQNHEQMARLFRSCHLGQRPKAHRQDYMNSMIQKSLDRVLPTIDIGPLTAWKDAILAARAEELARTESKRLESIHRALVERQEALITPKPKPTMVGPFDLGMEFADDFPPPPGLMGEVAQYIYAQSPYPLPRVSLAAAIAFMSGMTGRAYNVIGTGCNTYTLLVAPTASGKEAMSSGVARLVSELMRVVPSVGQYYGVSYIASGQALYAQIKERKSFLSIQSEFGLTLQELSSPRAPSVTKQLKKSYLELFTKSGRGNQMGASVFADKIKDTGVLMSPALSLLGETAPPHLYDALNETMLADGFLPRFLLIEQDAAEEVYQPKAFQAKPSDQLLGGLASLADQCLKMDMNNSPIDVAMTPEAEALADDYRAKSRSTANRQDAESGKQLWSRAHIKAVKLAALVAIGCNHLNPTITLEQLQWSIAVTNDGIKRLVQRFERGDLGEGDGRNVADMKRFLARYLTSNGHALPAAVFRPDMHAHAVVPHSYLATHLRGMASFRNGLGGSTATLLRTIQALVHEGTIQEVPAADAFARYQFTGRAFAVTDKNIVNF